MKLHICVRACIMLVWLAFIPAASAQSESTAHSWAAGDAALAYPAAWVASDGEAMSTGARLLLMNPGYDNTQLVVERIPTPDRRVFDLLASRLAEADVSIGAPVTTMLAGIPALEVHEAQSPSSVVGIGRGTNLADGSALLVWGFAPTAHGNALLTAFDQVVTSLVLGARQMPLQPDGTPYTRIGSSTLQNEVVALGTLTLDASAQLWSFMGVSGETISLYATDIHRTDSLNLRIRLGAPEGTVIAENDNHNGAAFYGLYSLYDAGLYNVTLPIDGLYTVEVSSVFGEGVYAIGTRRSQTIALEAGEATRVFGSIDDVFANQTWLFNGSAGTNYTFTMFAERNSTLDPALRLFAPDGRVLAQNDDARDPALGLNAQIVQVTLPQDGLYRLEATRYAGEGEGEYEIVILETAR